MRPKIVLVKDFGVMSSSTKIAQSSHFAEASELESFSIGSHTSKNRTKERACKLPHYRSKANMELATPRPLAHRGIGSCQANFFL
jgi:hypothetical protein